MYPLIFNFFPTYGLFGLLAGFAAIWIMRRELVLAGFDKEKYTDLLIILIISGLAGARALFVIIDYQRFFSSVSAMKKIFYLHDGGYVFFGGLLTGLIILFYLRKKIRLLPLLDIMALALPFAHIFGRMGCFMAGCCYGKPTDLPLGMRFGKESAAFGEMAVNLQVNPAFHTHTPPLYPTQLFEVFANLLVFVFLYLFKKNKKYHGQMAAFYLLLYGFFRFVIEIFRGDNSRGFVFRTTWPQLADFLHFPVDSPVFLSTSAFISLLMMVSASVFLIYKSHTVKISENK
ncbi:MAG: prolipoprotein diacylglyceryl transferase [Deltaproteobacteria bacterium]|nr:prolipoprotein diacylglyceryl transferase [Deltaproteobacteria bacterium]